MKAPLVYTHVAIKNWTGFQKLGIHQIEAPGSYHTYAALDFPVSLGEYRFPSKPDEPMVLFMLRTPCKPGLPLRDQHRAGRAELLRTSFSTFERNIRDQLGRMLGPTGFNAARDIDGITVNRWAHGYAYGPQLAFRSRLVRGREALGDRPKAVRANHHREFRCGRYRLHRLRNRPGVPCGQRTQQSVASQLRASVVGRATNSDNKQQGRDAQWLRVGKTCLPRLMFMATGVLRSERSLNTCTQRTFLRSSAPRPNPSFSFHTRSPRSLARTSAPRKSALLLPISRVNTKARRWVKELLSAGVCSTKMRRPVSNTLVELWQANAAGRYLHAWDQHDAPLDPNFTGCGHALTDHEGRYRFVTIKPGCYPWRNHHNAWRPAHIHFSLFGPAFATRLVTQMYFPGDPLLASDPIYNCTADEEARRRLIALFDWDTTIPETALGYRFDIVLRGRDETPMEDHA